MTDSDRRKKRTHQEPAQDLFGKMNRLFAEKPLKGLLQSMDDFFGSTPPNRSFPIELEETASEFIIKATIPGVKRNQIEIELFPQSITIHINQVNAKVKKQGRTDVLSRTVRLSKPINEKKVSASHSDGILKLTVPKIKGKTIPINE